MQADTTSYDPVKGGISIGPCRVVNGFVYTGTLGAIVTDNASGDIMLMSNFHVMCVDDAWSVGDTMAQPSRVDTGTCPGSVVGQLQRASLGGQVDVAVSSLNGRAHACEIVDIGAVNGTATATLGMAVRKRGRTTGLTYGTVDTIDLAVSIDYEDGLGTVTLTGQIGINVDAAQSTQFGNSGDSGSVVVDASRNVVGLYFAGTDDGSFGVANPIQAALGAMNVSLCVPKAKEKFEIKELKREKPEFKEFKREKIEAKELKREKIEIKELKREKNESKELKREKNESKELKIEKIEDKELLYEKFEIEKPDEHFPIDPTFPVQPGLPGPGGALADRMSRLEAILSQQSTAKSDAGAELQKPIFKETKNEKFEKNEKAEHKDFKELKHEKHEKREKPEKPEKLEKPEIKEAKAEKFEKPEKPENKEFKDIKSEKPEHKELKDSKHEKREHKEFKHEKLEFEKSDFEKPDFEKPGEFEPIDPQFPVQQSQQGGFGSLEQRLARLEAALGSMRHFIEPGLRPDLSTGALTHESDLSSTDLEALRRELQQLEQQARRQAEKGYTSEQ
ncbi:MAG TPA: hypothetical protein VEX37_04270 [Thermomicrobiales bacterium]|nr:hypothetical protein [Thermomicrobiales bacterium]